MSGSPVAAGWQALHRQGGLGILVPLPGEFPGAGFWAHAPEDSHV
jgi:hypothetical protein